MGSGAPAKATYPLGTSGGLFVVGAVLWIIHSVCVLAASLVVVASGGVSLTTVGAVAAGVAFLGALVTVLASSFLLSMAAHMLSGTVERLASRQPLQGLHETTGDTIRWSHYAGLSFTVHGILAALAFGVLVSLVLRRTLLPEEALGGLAALSFLWAVAAGFFLHAGTSLSDALPHIRKDFASDEWRAPPDLHHYAYLHMLGVVSITVPLLFIVAFPSPSPWDKLCFLVLGGILEGFVVPVFGIVSFASVVRFATAMTRCSLPTGGHQGLGPPTA